MKKALSLILAVIMALSCCVSAFAATKYQPSFEINCESVYLADENGNVLYEENMLSRHDIEADSVILAIGQGPVSILSDKAQIETTLRGLFAVDEKGMTNIPGVFAAGDVVSGPKTVVEAVAHTKRVSEHLIKYCYEKKNK